MELYWQTAPASTAIAEQEILLTSGWKDIQPFHRVHTSLPLLIPLPMKPIAS